MVEAEGFFQIDCPNVKLLLDVFHLQLLHGDITRNIKRFLPYAGHIQLAQAPNRVGLQDPGELNYSYILSLLQELGYDGWIGLEHLPGRLRGIRHLSWIR